MYVCVSQCLLHIVFCRYPHVPVDPDDLPIRPGLKPPYPYQTVGCIFNHEYFFANSQVFFLPLNSLFSLFCTVTNSNVFAGSPRARWCGGLAVGRRTCGQHAWAPAGMGKRGHLASAGNVVQTLFNYNWHCSLEQKEPKSLPQDRHVSLAQNIP